MCAHALKGYRGLGSHPSDQIWLIGCGFCSSQKPLRKGRSKPNSGGSRFSDGGGGCRLWDKGGAPSPKISFQLFGPHFGLKIRGVPRFLPWVHRCQIFKVIYDSCLWLFSCTHNLKIPPCQYFLVGEKELYGQNSIKIKPIKHFGALKVLLNMIKNLVTSLEWVLSRLSPGLRHWDGVCKVLYVVLHVVRVLLTGWGRSHHLC